MEWRLQLTHDPQTGWPASDETFGRVMMQLGLCKDLSHVVPKKGSSGVSLNLRYVGWSGEMCFYKDSGGKVTIGQSDPDLKSQIWHCLRQATEPFDGKPAKKRKLFKPHTRT